MAKRTRGAVCLTYLRLIEAIVADRLDPVDAHGAGGTFLSEGNPRGTVISVKTESAVGPAALREMAATYSLTAINSDIRPRLQVRPCWTWERVARVNKVGGEMADRDSLCREAVPPIERSLILTTKTIGLIAGLIGSAIELALATRETGAAIGY